MKVKTNKKEYTYIELKVIKNKLKFEIFTPEKVKSFKSNARPSLKW